MKQRQKKSRLLCSFSLSLSLLLFFSLSINSLLRDTFQQTSPVVKHALEEIDDEVEYVDTRFCLVGLEKIELIDHTKRKDDTIFITYIKK